MQIPNQMNQSKYRTWEMLQSDLLYIAGGKIIITNQPKNEKQQQHFFLPKTVPK